MYLNSMKKAPHNGIIELDTKQHTKEEPMTNYTTLIYELKRKITKTLVSMYSEREFKEKRTIYDLVYGISSSKSLMISEISRSLNEDININSTITRLDRNVNDEDFKLDLLSSSFVAQVKSITPPHLVVSVDDTDIIKPFGNKFEDLGMVRDGSTGNIVKGYPVLEMVTPSINAKQPITIYSEIYSSATKEFKSKNVVLFEALGKVVEKYGNNITFVFDRG